MSIAVNFAKKNILRILIKKVSNIHGGDDPEWLEEYIQEVISKYKNNYDTAISCFEHFLHENE